MSFPGMPMPSPDDQQAQQPLFGQPVINPDLIKIQQAIAQQMMQQGQDQTPISSPFQLAHKALSPLLGQLMQQHAAKQQQQMQEAAMPEIQAALKSDNPIAALAASHSPLVQQMAFQFMPDWMKAQIAMQSEIGKRKILDPMDVQKSVDTAVGTEKAVGPLKVQDEVAKARALLPIELEKVRAGQAETARHNKIMEGIAGGGLTPPGGNPWEQKWGP